MNLNQVTLPVNDMVRATKFYRTMGFLLIVDTPHYARFECTHGRSTFSLSLDENGGENASVIYFEHERLDELVAMLKQRGIEFDQDPTDMSYLWREAILHDPSGNKIKLYWAGENRLTPPWRVEQDSPVLIRHYEESDLEAVLSSWETATRLAHPFMTDEFIAKERINIAEVYMPNTDTWVVVINGNVEGFVALMGNEVGAIFLQPEYHGKGAGKALMDKAQELHGELEVEVFKENSIGRKFYAQYGFVYLEEKQHSPTGRQLLRLKFSPSIRSDSARIG